MGDYERDRIAARAVLSCIGEICHTAAMEEGDLESAITHERRLRKELEGINLDRMTQVVAFTLEYLGGKYRLENPIAVRETLELLIRYDQLEYVRN